MNQLKRMMRRDEARILGWLVFFSFVYLMAFACSSSGASIGSNVSVFDIHAVLVATASTNGPESISVAPLSPAEPLIDRVVLKGSYYDYGVRLGRIARKTVIAPKMIPARDRALNDSIRTLYRRIYPQHLEIVRGVADAFSMNPVDVDLRYMEYGFFIDLGWLDYDYQRWIDSGYPEMKASCSIAAVDAKNGGRLVGRNFEWMYSPGFVARSELQGSFKSEGLGIITWQHWVMDGVNEKGLFIGVMTVVDDDFKFRYNQSYPDEPAVNAHHMMRIVLDTCATVDEAVRLVSGIRCWFPSEWLHFMVADASGGKMIFEFDANGRLLPIKPEQGKPYLLSTNYYFTEDRSRPVFNSSDARYAIGMKLLDHSIIDGIDDMRAVMMAMAISPVNPRCRTNPSLKHVQTRWQDYYDLEKRTLRLYVSGTDLRTPYDFWIGN